MQMQPSGGNNSERTNQANLRHPNQQKHRQRTPNKVLWRVRWLLAGTGTGHVLLQDETTLEQCTATEQCCKPHTTLCSSSLVCACCFGSLLSLWAAGYTCVQLHSRSLTVVTTAA
jgi:hypothetical protein